MSKGQRNKLEGLPLTNVGEFKHQKNEYKQLNSIKSIKIYIFIMTSKKGERNPARAIYYKN